MRKYGAGLFIVALLAGSGFAAAGIASKVARFGAAQITTTGTTGTITLPTTGPATTAPTDTGEGAGKEKATVCHRPPGNPGNAHTITVGAPAVAAHLGHGDTLGPCPTGTTTVSTTVSTTTSTVGTTDSGAEKVTLCHRPPGNPGNAHTITVGAPAVAAHLGHGDTLGQCPTQTQGSAAQTGQGKGKSKGKPDKAGKSKGQRNGQGNGNGQGGGNGQGNEQSAKGRQNAPSPRAEPPKGKPNQPGKPEGSGKSSQGSKPDKGKGPRGKPRLLSWIQAWMF